LTISVASDNPIAGDNATSGITILDASDNTTSDNITGGDDNVTVHITGSDSNVVTQYLITENVLTRTQASNSYLWRDFSNPSANVSENVTYSLYPTPDNGSELRIYVWVRDNSSNVSDTYSMDNVTYYR
jgi:hypothetical protein